MGSIVREECEVFGCAEEATGIELLVFEALCVRYGICLQPGLASNAW